MGCFQQTAQLVGRYERDIFVAAALDDRDLAVARDLVEQGCQVSPGLTVCRVDHRFSGIDGQNLQREESSKNLACAAGSEPVRIMGTDLYRITVRHSDDCVNAARPRYVDPTDNTH
jgi:hypothetical protein